MANEKVSPFTLLAIAKFWEGQRLEVKAEKRRYELELLMPHVPPEDMAEYVKRTTVEN